MRKWLSIFILSISLAPSTVSAFDQPDWSKGFHVPANGRPNPYQFSEEELPTTIRAGKLHALTYPVGVTGSLLPFEPINRYFSNLNLITRWMGLHKFPKAEGKDVYLVPFPEGERPNYRMGMSLLNTPQGRAVSFSCATCHSANLFGKKIIGLTNRFPRANEAFVLTEFILKNMSLPAFKAATGATDEEIKMFERTIHNLQSVESVDPIVRGLDTSLAHVALSMSRRSPDEYATPSEEFQKHPRAEKLRSVPADSKPAVWWTLKYKNRWLSDGSLVSGNPILTNLLWNEIGRGTDLRELQAWMSENESVVAELATAVFSSEPPPITDFFPVSKINLIEAKRGQKIFLRACAGCHGVYEKRWDDKNLAGVSETDLLKTTFVKYPNPTPVIGVGTDSYRYQGMDSLARHLNPLKISKDNGILIEPQRGYVPPPLVGIWARWPYLHNNSVPSLCALLMPPEHRPKSYYAGEAIDPKKDFDFACNGYPSGADVPLKWRIERKGYVDTSRPGLGNRGHRVGPFTSRERHQLIQFLQTL